MREPEVVLSFSVEDMLTIKEFRGMSPEDLIHPRNDDIIREMLWKIGCDKNYPFVIQACQHRTRMEELVVGWRYVFVERTDKAWRDTKYATIKSHVEAQTDYSLKSDMMNASQEGIGAKGFAAMCLGATKENGGTSSTKVGMNSVEEQQDIIRTIRSLQEAQRNIRGELKYDENIFNK